MEDKTNLKNEKLSVKQANENDKPLDLTLIGGALFIRLAKSKKPKHKTKIFVITMQDIEYQPNKK